MNNYSNSQNMIQNILLYHNLLLFKLYSVNCDISCTIQYPTISLLGTLKAKVAIFLISSTLFKYSTQNSYLSAHLNYINEILIEKWARYHLTINILLTLSTCNPGLPLILSKNHYLSLIIVSMMYSITSPKFVVCPRLLCKFTIN